MATSSDKSKVNRRVIVAAGVAVCLLAAGGAGHRALSRHLDLAVRGEPIPAGTLEKLPLVLGDWTGRKQQIDESIGDSIGCDDWISRVYERRSTRDVVTLFVSAGVRSRDMSPHRPEVCYPGNGWTRRQVEDRTLSPDGKPPLPCRIFHFSRTGLTDEKTTVLNYFIIDGRCCPDVEVLRGRIWRGSKGVRYVGRVMITTDDRRFVSRERAEKAVKDFAAASAEPILDLLPGPSAGPAPATANGDQQGHVEGQRP